MNVSKAGDREGRTWTWRWERYLADPILGLPYMSFVPKQNRVAVGRTPMQGPLIVVLLVRGNVILVNETTVLDIQPAVPVWL